MFGVGALEQDILTLAVGALTTCGRQVPTDAEVYRYHGEPTHWKCCDSGTLYTYWKRAFPDRTGLPLGVNSPPGRQEIDLYLRLIRCWPEMGAGGVMPVGIDAVSEGLALDLDCLWSALYQAVCTGSLSANLAGCDALQLVDAIPRRPLGGCAGIEFHLIAGWRSWAPDPDDD